MVPLPERSTVPLLLLALLALSGVVVFVDARVLRLILALVVALAGLWAAKSFGAAKRNQSARPEGVERRRYLALRTRTDDFLRHIRALNLVAVQAQSGLRPQTDAEEQMNRIEQHLYVLVPELRRAAGRAA